MNINKFVPSTNFDFRQLNFRKQIAIALALAAIIPSIAITQGLIYLSQRFAEKQFDQIDRQSFLALGILQQELDRKLNEMVDIAGAAAMQAEANVNGMSPDLLQQSLRKSGASFLLITDEQGRTLSQQIRAVVEDGATYPKLPISEQKATSVSYREIEKPTGIDLGMLPIIRSTIQLRRTFSGTELLNSPVLNNLGLAEQAYVGIRPQKTEGLPELLRPLPEGTYNTENGGIGLVLMAAQPITIENRLIGVAIAGYLINRNPEIVDHVRLKTGIPTVTLFARDLRVSTNVPYTDKQTRAIGTRVSTEVAQTVLEQGHNFLGRANIVGTNYRTAYDHTRVFNKSSKPTGMAYVGQSLDEFEAHFWQLRLGGYLIGATAMLLAVVAALWLARSLTRPVKEIVQYAEALSTGDLEREAPGEYKAEMGELAGALKRLGTSVKTANKLIAKDYYEQGFQLYEKGDYSTAKIALQKAIALLPKDEAEHIQDIKQLLLQISSASILAQAEPSEMNGNRPEEGNS